MMKSLFRYILSVSAAIFAIGCNSGVFVDEFLPESPSVVVERSGEASKIRFKAANWDILSSVGGSTTLYGEIYDMNGNLVSRNQPLYGDGLLKMVYDDGLVDFRIERNDYRQLDIFFGENLYDRPYEVLIYVGNDYESGTVGVTFNPSEKYRVDSVAYQWDAFSFSDNSAETKDSFTINNSSSTEPATVVVYPYKNEHRTVEFFSNAYDDRREEILGVSLPKIEIPDVEEGLPVRKGTTASFVRQEQRLPLPFPDGVEAEVTLKPGEHKRVEVSVVYERFSVPYTVYASSPATGRQRTFSGKLYSSLPYKYYIFKLQPDQ